MAEAKRKANTPAPKVRLRDKARVETLEDRAATAVYNGNALADREKPPTEEEVAAAIAEIKQIQKELRPVYRALRRLRFLLGIVPFLLGALMTSILMRGEDFFYRGDFTPLDVALAETRAGAAAVAAFVSTIADAGASAAAIAVSALASAGAYVFTVAVSALSSAGAYLSAVIISALSNAGGSMAAAMSALAYLFTAIGSAFSSAGAYLFAAVVAALASAGAYLFAIVVSALSSVGASAADGGAWISSVYAAVCSGLALIYARARGWIAA